jgi:fumarate hydratase class I
MPLASPFEYHELFQLGIDDTPYYSLGSDGVSAAEFEGMEILKVEPFVLTNLAKTAFHHCSFMLRPTHLAQVAAILDDPEASDNDRYVALALLRNAEVAAKGLLPMCQDTGTAIVIARKGQKVWTGGGDAKALSLGIYQTYVADNLRYSQVLPIDMYNEINSGNNLPAQIDLYADEGAEYNFFFIAKGGGSANKTSLFQESKALLNSTSLEAFLEEKMIGLGTTACPPYHVTFVIGGTSAEMCLKAVKLASGRYFDSLPITSKNGWNAFRDISLERKLLRAAQVSRIGAQFGGKYFALDVRVIRLPRHAGSCPIGMGISCSADRHLKGKINRRGVWIEKLEENPGRFIPIQYRRHSTEDYVVTVDLDRPMGEIRQELSKYPVSTRLSLNGTVIVARDAAHAKLKQRIDAGEGLPAYFKDHPIYYAGPAKSPKGMATGSFGPTTAGRMDSYVDLFQSLGASMVMIAKGNRSQEVVASCRRHGGFYLGSIGGPAALLAQDNIQNVEVIDYPELGMEAVRKIVVKDFPVFILVDDKGKNFFDAIDQPVCSRCIQDCKHD